jgi:hypothetical protein
MPKLGANMGDDSGSMTALSEDRSCLLSQRLHRMEEERPCGLKTWPKRWIRNPNRGWVTQRTSGLIRPLRSRTPQSRVAYDGRFLADTTFKVTRTPKIAGIASGWSRSQQALAREIPGTNVK